MKAIFLLIALLFVLFVSGCQTFDGLGKDMKKAGQWVEDTVEDATDD